LDAGVCAASGATGAGGDRHGHPPPLGLPPTRAPQSRKEDDVRISDLDTPALICDLDILERNIATYQQLISDAGLALRPHIKTHKVPAIAHMQLAAGASGICCQKVTEAEVFVAAGIKDVLISYNIIGQPKLERLSRLARQADVTVAVDSAYAARGISAQAAADSVEVGVVIELAMGNRSGVATPQDAVELGRLVTALPGVRLRGLMGYPTGPDPECLDFFEATITAYRAEGLCVEMVSGGGTATAWQAAAQKPIGFTEHRVGTYIYHDCMQVQRSPHITLDDCALRVICTVVSRPTPDIATIDGGSKTFTNEGLGGEAKAHHIIEYPEARTIKQNEEHGVIDASACPRKPEIGERITVIPYHACVTANLHDTVVGVRGDTVEVIWPILARGRVH
jgi:D-serine deaminase-like pyridoxal phosphate-dependent protein